MGKNLVYTVALDYGGAIGHWNMAKMLVSSLLRTNFSGDILVFHNAAHPLFLLPRAGVEEVVLSPAANADNQTEFIANAQSHKYEVAKHISTKGYDKVLFLDCDSLALRNIDHLLHGRWSLAIFREMNSRIENISYGGYLTKRQQRLGVEGINSGSWAVTASRYHELMERWKAIESNPPAFDCLREQSAFNKVVLEWPRKVVEWPQREIALPFCVGNLTWFYEYSSAAIVHTAGAAGPLQKLPFLFGLFASQFLCDERLTLFNVMEM